MSDYKSMSDEHLALLVLKIKQAEKFDVEYILIYDERGNGKSTKISHVDCISIMSEAACRFAVQHEHECKYI